MGNRSYEDIVADLDRTKAEILALVDRVGNLAREVERAVIAEAVAVR